MLKSHEKFHSANGKRMILVADDEIINREILGEILRNDYDVIFAEDGRETLEKVRDNKDMLSLVILDILMPGMSGLEVLKSLKEDEELSNIPVIVATSERKTEVESLQLGATDFIPKPYPEVDVILARVLRTIELFEDRDIIQSTERDVLTGLYNKEYFYRYAEQFDQHHKNMDMDAVVVDINHFRMINERYGRAYGDDVLCRIGDQVRDIVKDSGGIVCRMEADTFLVYCPHREDYQDILDRASVNLQDDGTGENRVRLRMGVYYNVDKSIDMERRFDRAKMAADQVKDNFTKTIGVYDIDLHNRQIYAEQLIEDFPTAIAEKQFQVYYQPKFDIRPDTPMLASAEALVRWTHPTLGMINPGIFIPLFEENGLVQKLDRYVWNETAAQINKWKEEYGYSVPVSVNVSRVDMYEPKLADMLIEILSEHGLTCKDLLLEVTESAYTQDSKQIIETVENLRDLGFQIEMDDFGTGYSSLNMISNLPIDALKLDMQFIRSAFSEGGNTHMVEVIISIADYLSVPVIAEGVETEEQLRALRILGCDIVQGYFFSKPVPAKEFEPFILQKKEADNAAKVRAIEEAENRTEAEEQARQAKLDLILEGTEEEETPDEEVPEEPEKEHTGIQLKTASVFFVIIAFIAAIALLATDIAVTRGYERMEKASDRYIAAQMAASNMESGSDYLTDRVRCFVVTGEIEYLKDFVEEVEVTRRRDRAVEDLTALLGSGEHSAIENLNTALTLSNELVEKENLAMRLIIEQGNYNPSDIPDDIKSIQLSPEDRALTPDQMREKARNLVFDNNYMHYKDRIRENVSLCTQALIHSSSQELENASSRLAVLVNFQTAITIVFLMLVLAIVYLITRYVRRPLTQIVEKMQDQEMITPTGVEELRFVTRTYNRILKDNKQAREKLSHEASHDALTGLYNRGAYDLLMEDADTKHMALILIDVDYFKSVNDTYGHAVGDRVLKRVAEILRATFRSVDILCRIGGDEFAVVMTRVDSSMRHIVLSKMMKANDLLQHPKDDLPPVSLSVGVAFADRDNPQGDIFTDADTALYRVKEAGRNGCQIY
ncbi:MAG: EAL domain-containing protein [Oscillospiraceae bacterium]|nr:EAL domain-containing protein [Oscillospiraceae bacterium]